MPKQQWPTWATPSWTNLEAIRLRDSYPAGRSRFRALAAPQSRAPAAMTRNRCRPAGTGAGDSQVGYLALHEAARIGFPPALSLNSTWWLRTTPSTRDCVAVELLAARAHWLCANAALYVNDYIQLSDIRLPAL